MAHTEANVAGRWVIRHETVYRYSTPVAFAPHVLRLTPRADSVRCLERSLTITPSPSSRAEFVDSFNNGYTSVLFDTRKSESLVIDSRIVVETLARPVLDSNLALPLLPWPAPGYDSLYSYRQPDPSPEVLALAHRLAWQVGHAPLAFFELLCRTLSATSSGKFGSMAWLSPRAKRWRRGAALAEI